MARKTEKLDKKEEKRSVFQVNLEKQDQIQNLPRVKSSGRGWCNFGKKNDTPYVILDMYNNSPTLKSCIQFCCSALIGNGVILDNETQSVPNAYENWDSFIRKLSLDYLLHGAYSIQIIRNRDGSSYSFYHQDIATVRCGERDSDGLITEYYISKDWTSPNKPGNEPIEIDAFIMRPDNEYNLKLGKPYLFVFHEYCPQIDMYWLPCWYSAIKSVQSEIEYLTYDLSNSQNSFLAAGAISMPPAADDEEKQAIVEEIRNTFIGSSNSARLMICFRNDSDNDQPVQFTKFSNDSGEYDMFNSANERAISRILSVFSIPSRLLIGQPEQNAGFSSEGALLETAFRVYNAVQGRNFRRAILGTINSLFAMNGIDVNLQVRELSFDISNDDTRDETVNVDITEDNIEEQEV